MFRFRNLCTAISLAAFNTVGAPPPDTLRTEDTFMRRFVDAAGVWHLIDKSTGEARRLTPGNVATGRLQKTVL